MLRFTKPNTLPRLAPLPPVIVDVSAIVEDRFLVTTLCPATTGGGARARRLMVSKSPATAVWEVWCDDDLNRLFWYGLKLALAATFPPLPMAGADDVDIRSMEDAKDRLG